VIRSAVLGSPIAHSLSPALHRAAYAALGLDWAYDAIECGTDDLPALLGRQWAGLSLTMPLKRAVLPLLDEASELTQAVGAANTVVYQSGRRVGFNTDVHGVVAALAESGVRLPGSAVVLGGGATACSALAALRDLHLPKATVIVREPARAAEAAAAADRLGVDPYAETVARATGALFDVVYDPWPTALAEAVRARGGTVAGGFPILLHQAARQVALMTGHDDVPVEAMRAAGLEELGRRSAR